LPRRHPPGKPRGDRDFAARNRASIQAPATAPATLVGGPPSGIGPRVNLRAPGDARGRPSAVASVRPAGEAVAGAATPGVGRGAGSVAEDARSGLGFPTAPNRRRPGLPRPSDSARDPAAQAMDTKRPCPCEDRTARAFVTWLIYPSRANQPGILSDGSAPPNRRFPIFWDFSPQHHAPPFPESNAALIPGPREGDRTRGTDWQRLILADRIRSMVPPARGDADPGDDRPARASPMRVRGVSFFLGWSGLAGKRSARGLPALEARRGGLASPDASDPPLAWFSMDR
jgi:hypothetical protein